MNYRDPQLRAALVAAYVLGTLQGPARARFVRLLNADFKLQQEVQRWQEDFYPALIDTLPEQPPPHRVWQKIEAQTKPQPEPEPKTGFWNNLFWPLWSSVATAAVLVLVMYIGLLSQTPVSVLQADYFAVINDNNNQAAWLIQIDPRQQRLKAQVLLQQNLAADRSFELWLLPAGGAAPQSLGLLPSQGEIFLPVAIALQPLLPDAGGVAVSLEPQGGSPTGLPTGPILYQGKLATTQSG